MDEWVNEWINAAAFHRRGNVLKPFTESKYWLWINCPCICYNQLYLYPMCMWMNINEWRWEFFWGKCEFLMRRLDSGHKQMLPNLNKENERVIRETKQTTIAIAQKQGWWFEVYLGETQDKGLSDEICFGTDNFLFQSQLKGYLGRCRKYQPILTPPLLCPNFSDCVLCTGRRC